MRDTYHCATTSVAEQWHPTGCYLARKTGLWYFDACPTGAEVAAAMAAPEKAGGVLELPADLLQPKPEGDVPDPENATTIDQAKGVACAKQHENGMSKEAENEICRSLAVGPLSISGSSVEMGQTSCQAASTLDAVEPGLHPARCIHEAEVVGTWRFTTRVYRAKDAKALGAQGHYVLDVKLGDGCALTARLEKRGIGGKMFAPDEVQTGTGTLAQDCERSDDGTRCYRLETRLADKAGKGFDAVYTLLLDASAKRVEGGWQYQHADLDTLGYGGLLQGDRGAGDAPARYAIKDGDERVCLARAARLWLDDTGRLSTYRWAPRDDAVDAYEDCMAPFRKALEQPE
ncbi:MAG: hypothetical protein U1F43_29220 [Myxococcota bacterium]